MSDKIFLDTNIIVYAFDKEDARKNITAKELLDNFYTENDYLISTQVMQEFCNVAYNKMKPALTGDEIKNFVSSFSEDKIYIIEKETIKKAIYIKEKFRYSFWDSLIIASALLSSCNKLYSEDMTDGQIIENLTIMNPIKF